MKEFRYVFIAVILTALLIAWSVYAFKDCKKVGHSTLYCIGMMG